MKRLFGFGQFTYEQEVDPQKPEKFNWKFVFFCVTLISIFSLQSKDVNEINLPDWCINGECTQITTKPGNIIGTLSVIALISSFFSKKN